MALSFIRGVLFERVTVTISSPKEHIGTFFSDSKIFRFVLLNVNLKKRNKNNIDESFVLLLSILNFVDEWCFPSILEKRRRWRIKGEAFFKGWNILTVTHSHTRKFSFPRKRSGQKMAGLCYTEEIHTRVKE